MSEFTLGNWTFSDDEVNDELVFRSLNTNDEFRVDNTGGFSSDVDLKGNSLTDSTQDFLDLTGDGNNLRVASNQSIEDDSGTRRVSFASGETSLRDSAGKTGFVARDGGSTRIDAYNGQPLDIRDQEGAYDAVRYNTSATAPGTFEFPNASIDMGGNDISNAGILNGGQVGTSSEPVDVEAATVTADSVNAGIINHDTDNVGSEARLINDQQDIIHVGTQITKDVSTTEVSVYDDNAKAGVAYVAGTSTEEFDVGFFDVIVPYQPTGDSPDIINSTSWGGAASRTYGNPSSTELPLSMSGGTYDVAVFKVTFNLSTL